MRISDWSSDVCSSDLDAIKNKKDMFAYVGKIMEQHAYSAVVPVSALRGVQLEQLLSEIGARLPEGEPMFDADTLTDRPVRFIAAELLREKLFRLVGDELPYGCTVVIEQWDEDDATARVAECIVIERESNPQRLLGHKGAHMTRRPSQE